MTWVDVEGACFDCIYENHHLCDGWFSGGIHKPCRCAQVEHRLPIVTAGGFVPPVDVIQQRGTT